MRLLIRLNQHKKYFLKNIYLQKSGNEHFGILNVN